VVSEFTYRWRCLQIDTGEKLTNESHRNEMWNNRGRAIRTVSAFPQIRSLDEMEGAMTGKLMVNFVLNLKPELTERFCTEFVVAASQARSFPGCRKCNMYRNDTNPNRILMNSEWEGKEDYDKYIAWRAEGGKGFSWIDSLVAEYMEWKAGKRTGISAAGWLTSPSEPEYWYFGT
jgi:quinol monooxygenase YgiN